VIQELCQFEAERRSEISLLLLAARMELNPEYLNTELKRLYEVDVHDHSNVPPHGTPEYIAMRERDKQRRQQISDLIERNQVQMAADFFHAAQIFQHGDTPDDAWKAHELALRSVKLGEPRAKWLAAAAYDRWLMYSGTPQKYGTQFVPDDRRQRLWDVDPATTDDERAAWDVPPLAEQLRKAEEATRLDPPQPIGDEAPQWLKNAIKRWGGGRGLNASPSVKTDGCRKIKRTKGVQKLFSTSLAGLDSGSRGF
jgi:hypothetical protein